MIRWIYKLPLRLRSLFERGRVEQELSDEPACNWRSCSRNTSQEGMTSEEALYAALRELGGAE